MSARTSNQSPVSLAGARRGLEAADVSRSVLKEKCHIRGGGRRPVRSHHPEPLQENKLAVVKEEGNGTGAPSGGGGKHDSQGS